MFVTTGSHVNVPAIRRFCVLGDSSLGGAHHASGLIAFHQRIARRHGANLRIISDNVLTVAEFVWAVKPDSPIKSIKDFKGKKIGYTNPRSTSQALARMLLQQAGYSEADAELVKTGGFGEGIAALDSGQIDVAAITEPLWSKVKNKYRAVVVASETLPPLDNVVGVTTV